MDLSPLMASAIDDVGALEFDAARTQVAAIDGRLQGATTSGLMRLGGLLSVLGMAIGLGFWLRRRRSTAVTVVSEAPHAEIPVDEYPVLPGQIAMVEPATDAHVTDAA